MLEYQHRFIESKARNVALVGGRGVGKTRTGAHRILLHALREPGSYGVVAPTYTMLEDLDWAMVLQMADIMRIHIKPTKSAMRMQVANRSIIRFRSADQPKRLRGLSVHGLWIDEGGEIAEEAFKVLIPTVREGSHPWLATTLSPKGTQHWTYRRFGPEARRKNTEVIDRIPTDSNIFLDEMVRADLHADLDGTGVWARQELGGEWVDPDDVEWAAQHWGEWVLVDSLPHQRLTRRVIAVDPSLGHGPKSDYSAIVAVGVADGLLWVEADLARRPPHQLIADTLVMADRWRPNAVGMEAVAFQEVLVQELIRQRQVPWPVFGIKQDASKPMRIRRLGPAIIRRELRIADTPGGRLLYQQLRSWPMADHDDGPDALEMAIRLLTEVA